MLCCRHKHKVLSIDQFVWTSPVWSPYTLQKLRWVNYAIWVCFWPQAWSIVESDLLGIKLFNKFWFYSTDKVFFLIDVFRYGEKVSPSLTLQKLRNFHSERVVKAIPDDILKHNRLILAETVLWQFFQFKFLLVHIFSEILLHWINADLRIFDQIKQYQLQISLFLTLVVRRHSQIKNWIHEGWCDCLKKSIVCFGMKKFRTVGTKVVFRVL